MAEIASLFILRGGNLKQVHFSTVTMLHNAKIPTHWLSLLK